MRVSSFIWSLLERRLPSMSAQSGIARSSSQDSARAIGSPMRDGSRGRGAPGRRASTRHSSARRGPEATRPRGLASARRAAKQRVPFSRHREHAWSSTSIVQACRRYSAAIASPASRTRGPPALHVETRRLERYTGFAHGTTLGARSIKSRVPYFRAGVRGANLSDRPEAF